MLAAVGMYIIGFICWVASTPKEGDKQRPGEQGVWIGGVKLNRYQGWIMWLHVFNW
jgi:hypothetical protein